jgi:hypothetical protein
MNRTMSIVKTALRGLIASPQIDRHRQMPDRA